MYGGSPLQPNLVFGRGFCSDDTEHTQMVGRAIALSGGEIARFERELGRQFKRWLLTLPAGVGLATLRACIRLLFGFGPGNSGVFSAGNGPAMRSALIGVWTKSDSQLRPLVRSCTRITHTDPKAEEGALLVARAASLTVNGFNADPVEFLNEMLGEIHGAELRGNLQKVIDSLIQKQNPSEVADAMGWSNGVSGYINQSVPAALFCWASSPDDFRQCVESAALLGGDSDSVAAITGAICGANLGNNKMPADWLDQMAEWPRTVEWMKQLAKSLCDEHKENNPPGMYWMATIPRNVLFATCVIGLGFRRLFPPY